MDLFFDGHGHSSNNNFWRVIRLSEQASGKKQTRCAPSVGPQASSAHSAVGPNSAIVTYQKSIKTSFTVQGVVHSHTRTMSALLP